MGDGSFIQSVMLLQPGAAGSCSGTSEGPRAVDGFDLMGSSAHQQLDKRLSGGTVGTSSISWMQNGVSQQVSDPSAGMESFDCLQQQQHSQLAGGYSSGTMTGQYQQHFEFPNSLHQLNPMQAAVNAQLAQLHGSFENSQQQQPASKGMQSALQLAQAARSEAEAVAAAAQWQRALLETSHHQPRQQQHQLTQQPPAISALRQGLLLQQQMQQQLQQQAALKQQMLIKQGSDVGRHQLHAISGNAAASAPATGFNSGSQLQLPPSSNASSTHVVAAANSAGGSAVRTPHSSTSSKAKLSVGGPPSSNLTIRLTVQLVATYQRCKPQDPSANVPQPLPRRVLTKPGAAVKNDGWDNEHSDLVLCTQDVLVNAAGQRYIVLDMLGSGTFGQVVSAYSEVAGKAVAVKVIKNQPAYYHQARVEVGILQLLNGRCDPSDVHHIVRLHDAFLHKRHLCLAFEQLGINLFELLKRNGFRGLSLGLLRLFLQQILDALIVLRDASIIHCDLKPENILLAPPSASGGALGQLKIIDFGSACFEHRTVYSYIQSRFYRSPEVLLGLSYTASIDMWSFGCVAAELFLGLPLFPGASEHDLLTRIIETLGPPPPWMMAAAKRTSAFFKQVPGNSSGSSSTAATVAGDGGYAYALYTKEEFEAVNKCQAPAGKRYFTHSRLADIIGHYPFKQGATDAEEAHERKQREALLDLLIGVLDLDPKTRWTPRQAIKHPFITGEPFTGPYQPAADTAPLGIHHHHLQHQHQHRHAHHHHAQQQHAASAEQQQYALAAAAAAAAAAAVGSFGAAQEQQQLVGSLGGIGADAGLMVPPMSNGPSSFGQQQSTRTGPVAMAARSTAQHQQQQYASAAANLMYATPPSGLLGPGSFPGAAVNGSNSFVPGSTSNLLQYSPAAAQVHARAHAIAMAALQQLSPQLGSSFPAQAAVNLLGTSLSGRAGSGSYTASVGMNLLHQHQQQQQLSSSLSPARPLIPTGRTSSSQHQQLVRQQQQQQQLGSSNGDFASQQATAMITSPAPQHARRSSLTGGNNNGSRSLAGAPAAAAAAGDYLGGSLAQSFNHNLLMSPVGPAHMNSVAAALAAAQQRQQQQQPQQQSASVPRSNSLQQRWRAAMDQQQQQAVSSSNSSAPMAAGVQPVSSVVGATGLHMQHVAQQQQQQVFQFQQQQQQPALGSSWQQAPGLLGSSLPSAAVDNILWQQLQHAHQVQQAQQAAASAAAAALAYKAAASSASPAAVAAGSFSGAALAGIIAAEASAQPAAVQNGFNVFASQVAGQNSSDGNPGLQRGGDFMRVSADDGLFTMEDTPDPGGSNNSIPDMQQEQQEGQRHTTGPHGPTAAAAAAGANVPSLPSNMRQQAVAVQQQQQPLQYAAIQRQQLCQLETIASSPLEIAPIEEQHIQQQAQAAAQLGLRASMLQKPQQPPPQQHVDDDDLELQEEEVMAAADADEHPGDWNPLYSDEQLLDDQLSPQPSSTGVATAAAAAGTQQGGLDGLQHAPAQMHAVARLFNGPLQSTVLTGAGLTSGAAAESSTGAADFGGVMLQNGTSRSRRGSMMHVRAMSIELPEGNLEDELEREFAAAESGSLPVRPAAAAGSGAGASPRAEDLELDVTLGPHWSFKPPLQLLQNPLQQGGQLAPGSFWAQQQRPHEQQ